MENNKTNLLVNSIEFVKHPVINLKRKLHPVLLKQMPARRDFELKFINQKPEIDGPTLFLVTHSNVHDAPITCEILDSHFYILIAKQKLKLLDRAFFELNGKIEVDRDSRESGLKASKKMEKLLKAGTDVVMYPERTWCSKASTPINHCRWGWFDIAKNTNATVLPAALEYYEYTDNCCYVNFGQPFKVTDLDTKELRNIMLEDELATLKYEIWNQFPQQNRKDIPQNLWNAIMTLRYREIGSTPTEMEAEKNYIIGRQSDPDYIFNSPEFKLSQQKLEKVFKK